MGSIDALVAIKDTIFMVMVSSKYFWGNHQNNTDTQQPKQNQFIGRGGMNVYNAGVIHCNYIYIPYNACFTGTAQKMTLSIKDFFR